MFLLIFVLCSLSFYLLNIVHSDSLHWQSQRVSSVHANVVDLGGIEKRRTSTADPEATDCSSLLNRFRDNDVDVVKSNSLFKTVHVALTSADINNKTFYIATHEKSIDYLRARIIEQGKYYETALSKLVAEVFEKKSTKGKESIFLDIGANIGWFSLVAATHGASKVYSFEPNLQNTIRFCESLSLNGWLDGSVIPISKGVGNVEEERKLYAVTANNPGSFSFGTESGTVVGKMNITTLDKFAERHNWFVTRPTIGFLKLDVEKFELQVIEGAEKLLNSRLVEMIAMEVKYQPKESRSKIVKILFDAGYQPTKHGGNAGPDIDIQKGYNDWNEVMVDLDSFEANVLFELK